MFLYSNPNSCRAKIYISFVFFRVYLLENVVHHWTMVLLWLDTAQRMVVITGLWGIHGVPVGERRGISGWSVICSAQQQAYVELRWKPLTLSRQDQIHPTPVHLLHLQLSLHKSVIITIPVQKAAPAAALFSFQTIAMNGDVALLRLPPAVTTTIVVALMTSLSATLMQGSAWW